MLLKNINETLPLNPATVGRMLLVGPHANATQALLGNYFGQPPFIVSPVEGIQGYGVSASFVLGCDSVECANTTGELVLPAPFEQPAAFRKWTARRGPCCLVELVNISHSQQMIGTGLSGFARGAGFPEAVRRAKEAESVVLVVGIDNDSPSGEGEGKDRNSIYLPGMQHALVRAVRAYGRALNGRAHRSCTLTFGVATSSAGSYCAYKQT